MTPEQKAALERLCCGAAFCSGALCGIHWASR